MLECPIHALQACTNMYNPKSKISLFFLSPIRTMLVEFQGGKKRKQEDKTSEKKRMIKLEIFSKLQF